MDDIAWVPHIWKIVDSTNRPKMNDKWYTAKCLYRAVHVGDEPPHEPLSELRYFLTRGDNQADAMKKALVIAKRRQHSYQNQFGATVNWKLEQVIDAKEIFDFELKDGLEIYHEYIDGDPR